MSRRPLPGSTGCARAAAAPRARRSSPVPRAQPHPAPAALRSAAGSPALRTAACACAVLKVVPRIGAVERLVAERAVGDDVALDRGLQQRPLEPGRIAQMAARDPAAVEPQPDQDVAAESLVQPQAFRNVPLRALAAAAADI